MGDRQGDEQDDREHRGVERLEVKGVRLDEHRTYRGPGAECHCRDPQPRRPQQQRTNDEVDDRSQQSDLDRRSHQLEGATKGDAAHLEAVVGHQAGRSGIRGRQEPHRQPPAESADQCTGNGSRAARSGELAHIWRQRQPIRDHGYCDRTSHERSSLHARRLTVDVLWAGRTRNGKCRTPLPEHLGSAGGADLREGLRSRVELAGQLVHVLRGHGLEVLEDLVDGSQATLEQLGLP